MGDTNGIIIRPFAHDDREKVVAFFDQMDGETRGYFNRGDGNRNLALKYFEVDIPGIVRFMALADDCMVGYVFLWDMGTGVPSLGIAVAEHLKGQHLGRRLIETAHDHARRCGKGGVMLTTDISNMRGQGLYERMGYEKLGISTAGSFLYLFRFKTTDDASK